MAEVARLADGLLGPKPFPTLEPESPAKRLEAEVGVSPLADQDTVKSATKDSDPV